MARYDLTRGWFRTPRRHNALMYVREGTNDWNTCYAAMNEDEYGLHDLRLSGLALDIGAHLGAVTVSLLLDNPDLRVEAVEPLPENAELLMLNARSNSVDDRLLVHVAAAGDGEPVTIRYAYTDNENDLHHAFIGNSLNTGDTSREHREATVPSKTAHDWDGAAFVKLDCEGGEWPFLLAGLDAIAFPLLVGEWHPVHGHTRAEFARLLQPAYDLTFTGPEAGPGGFRAISHAREAS